MKWFFIIPAMFLTAAGWRFRDQIEDWIPRTEPQSLPTRTIANLPEPPGTIVATGFVEGATESVELRFEIPGRLKNLPVKEGDRVRQGELLAELDCEVQGQRVLQAKADLALANARQNRLENAARSETRQVARAKVLVAQSELSRAEDHADRMRRLFDREVSSEDEWKEAFHKLQAAKARLTEQQAHAAEIEAPARADDLEVAAKEVAVAQAILEHAQVMLKQTRLISPMDGTILNISKYEGEMVDAADPVPVLVLSNLDAIRVRAYVEELHALRVSVGDAVRVKADGLDEKDFSGIIVFCAPWMNQKKYRTHKPNELLDVRTREIVIEMADAQELVVGLPVEVIITPAKPTPHALPLSSPQSPSPLTQSPHPKDGQDALDSRVSSRVNSAPSAK